MLLLLTFKAKLINTSRIRAGLLRDEEFNTNNKYLDVTQVDLTTAKIYHRTIEGNLHSQSVGILPRQLSDPISSP